MSDQRFSTEPNVNSSKSTIGRLSWSLNAHNEFSLHKSHVSGGQETFRPLVCIHKNMKVPIKVILERNIIAIILIHGKNVI